VKLIYLPTNLPQKVALIYHTNQPFMLNIPFVPWILCQPKNPYFFGGVDHFEPRSCQGCSCAARNQRCCLIVVPARWGGCQRQLKVIHVVKLPKTGLHWKTYSVPCFRQLDCWFYRFQVDGNSQQLVFQVRGI